jgi:hypothetical protein
MALLKPYTDISMENKDANKIQLNLKQFFQQFNDLIFLQGRLLSDLDISTATTEVEHKLGRQPVGWFLVDKDATGNIWRVSWDDKYITFDVSANMNVSIWIF